MQKIGDIGAITELNSYIHDRGGVDIRIGNEYLRNISSITVNEISGRVSELVFNGSQVVVKWMRYTPMRQASAYLLKSNDFEYSKFRNDVIDIMKQRDVDHPLWRPIRNIEWTHVGGDRYSCVGFGDIIVNYDTSNISISFIEHIFDRRNVQNLLRTDYEPILLAVPNQYSAAIDIGDGDRRHEVTIGIYPKRAIGFVPVKQI